MTVLILVVFLTIFISAQCSLYEATLYSTRLGTLEAAKLKARTKKLALMMIQMKKQISVPIAAILILNTIANTAGATIAGMYAHKTLGTALVPVFSVVFTLAILFLAEIIPKTMGAVYWRTLWPVIVWPLTAMKYPLYPIIWVTEKFSEFLTRGVRLLPSQKKMFWVRFAWEPKKVRSQSGKASWFTISSSSRTRRSVRL